jgi:predicted DNA-binding transcriptional regulator AlpA
MGERKQEVERPYPPDYVSAETLAYRLDVSRSTIESYVKAGLLPEAEMIGNLPRWDFAEVRAFIKARAAERAGSKGQQEDEYFEGLKRAATAQS